MNRISDELEVDESYVIQIVRENQKAAFFLHFSGMDHIQLIISPIQYETLKLESVFILFYILEN